MIADAQTLARTRVHASAPACSLFDVRITPHNSLPADKMLIVSAVIIAVSLLLQFALIRAGAWPAAIFLGFDAVFLFCALIVMQTRLQRHEDIVLQGQMLRITRYDRGQLNFQRQVSCYRLVIVRHEDPEFGLRALHLWDGQKDLEIARDLSPAERETFFAALFGALRDTGLTPRIHHKTLGLDVLQTAASGVCTEARP